MTAIEELVELLKDAGVEIGDILVPEGCATVNLNSGTIHITAEYLP